MRRIVVTGGTGFIGANLVRRLLADGHEVALLVRPGANRERVAAIAENLRFCETELADREKLREIFREVRPDWIFHLAAFGNYSWQSELATMVETNLLGTARLLEVACGLGFDAFVHAGSSSEYGFREEPPSESERLDPNSYYSLTKAGATHCCRLLAARHRLRIPTLRLYSIYGPYEDSRRLVPRLIERGLEGRLPELVHPSVARDFIYVDDACEAFVRAAEIEHPEHGAVYNIASGRQTTVRELVELVREMLPIPEEPRWGSMPDRSWDTDRWAGDSSLARRILGWTACTPLRDGLARTIEIHRMTSGEGCGSRSVSPTEMIVRQAI